MERLTRRKTANIAGKEIALCNYKEDDCNDSCMYGRCKWQKHANMKLKEYEDLEEDGKLLKLPCAIGDTVYYIHMDCPKDYKKEYCKDHDGSCEKCHHRAPTIMSKKYTLNDIGIPVYTTEQEAKKTLERIKKREESEKSYLEESRSREDDEQAAYLREWSRRHKKHGRTGKTQ